MTANRRKPLFWGCDFDPNPDMHGIRRKLTSFILNEGRSAHMGPYRLFKERQSAFSEADGCFGGLFPCPSWLSSSPEFQQELYPEDYRRFINSGGCRDMAVAFGEYVFTHTPDDRIPVVLGVDHCLSGGLYRMIEKKRKDVALVVLDRHLDAISPACRNRMVGYAQAHENKKNKKKNAGLVEYFGPDFLGNYDTGSFLRYLITNLQLSPADLFVFGNQDAPAAKLRENKDPAIREYLAEYDGLIEAGATIIPLKEYRKQNFFNHHQELNGALAGRCVYLSVDVDVFDTALGDCARYADRDGFSLAEARRLLQWLGLEQAELIGMDMMELDVNRLHENRTTPEEIAASFLDILQLAFPDPAPDRS